MILERTTASCISTGFEQGVPNLSTEKLNALAKQTKFLMLMEVPDNISANFLKRKETASKLAANILYPPGNCVAHRLSRIATVSLREDDTIGDIYKTQLVAQSPPHATKLSKSLDRACEEMDILDPFAHPPDQVCTKMLKQILDYTTMRRFELVRGRADQDGSLWNVKGAIERQEKNQRLVDMLDGVDNNPCFCSAPSLVDLSAGTYLILS
jgi:hypothetical protein